MRVLRIVGIGVGVLVALLIVVLLAVKLFVNPNDYRGRIEQAVQHSTGRQLQLTGDLKLSVFPWVALDLGPASLGNPAGFGTEPFATVQHVSFRVKLLPLLGKRLEVGHIEIDQLDLRLKKNADGKGNWENFGSSETSPPPAAAPAKTEDSGSGGVLEQVDGILIKDSRFSYQDMVADHLNLTTGAFASGTTMPVDLSMNLVTAKDAAPIEFAANMKLTPDMQKKQYRLVPLELKATLHPTPKGTAVAWKFSCPDLSLDLDAQTLEAPAFSTQLDRAQISGVLHGAKIVDAPAFTGSFKLDQMSPRDLMTALGMQAPVTRDPKALTSFAASGQFSYGGNAARATALDVRLDESRLQGEAAITDLQTNAMSFNLNLDRIDVDHYLSPPPPPGKAPPPAATRSAADAKADANPGEALKKLQLKGAFTIGSLTAANLNLSQVKLNADAKDGVIHLSPISANLYDGTFNGDITLDSGTSLALKLRQTMNNVDIAKLLKDMANTERLSGHGNVSTDITAQGWDAPAIMRTLNGHVAANLTDGAVVGMDLWFEINRAMALIQKQAMPSGSSSGRTKFDTFKASADLSNGVATTKDLTINSQNLRVAGQGTSNLVNDQVNYQVTATVLKELPSAAKAGGTKLADIPLTITGTMSNPQIRPDLEGMAKARVQQELDKHQDEIKQKVQDSLKGLFK